MIETIGTKMTAPLHELAYGSVIDPEVPQRKREKRLLLDRSLGAKAYGHAVRGVTPRHIGSEGMYLLNRQPNRLEEPRGPQY